VSINLITSLEFSVRFPTELMILPVTFPISFTAFFEFSANFPISFATTAKPFPASPALAASIVAFSAKRLV
jgi:hypothetical protein